MPELPDGALSAPTVTRFRLVFAARNIPINSPSRRESEQDETQELDVVLDRAIEFSKFYYLSLSMIWS